MQRKPSGIFALMTFDNFWLVSLSVWVKIFGSVKSQFNRSATIKIYLQKISSITQTKTYWKGLNLSLLKRQLNGLSEEKMKNPYFKILFCWTCKLFWIWSLCQVWSYMARVGIIFVAWSQLLAVTNFAFCLGHPLTAIIMFL